MEFTCAWDRCEARVQQTSAAVDIAKNAASRTSMSWHPDPPASAPNQPVAAAQTPASQPTRALVPRTSAAPLASNVAITASKLSSAFNSAASSNCSKSAVCPANLRNVQLGDPARQHRSAVAFWNLTCSALGLRHASLGCHGTLYFLIIVYNQNTSHTETPFSGRPVHMLDLLHDSYPSSGTPDRPPHFQ